MNQRIIAGLFLCIFAFPVFSNIGEGTSSEQEEYLVWATNLWDSLDRQTGAIRLPSAAVNLTR